MAKLPQPSDHRPGQGPVGQHLSLVAGRQRLRLPAAARATTSTSPRGPEGRAGRHAGEARASSPRCDIEWDYDYGFVLTSTDGGKSYTSLRVRQRLHDRRRANPERERLPGQVRQRDHRLPDSYDNGTAAVDRVLGNYGRADVRRRLLRPLRPRGQGADAALHLRDRPGAGAAGWFIDDVKVTAGDRVIYSPTSSRSDDTAIYNGGCNGEELQTARTCTTGWSYIDRRRGLAGRARLPDGAARPLRLRRPRAGRRVRPRDPPVPYRGCSLAYTDENHGYGNVGTDDPPAQSPLDATARAGGGGPRTSTTPPSPRRAGTGLLRRRPGPRRQLHRPEP